MNIFVLCTGRCGSTTFIRACEHIENYSAGHETRVGLLGRGRMDYPADHIEADNRLSWHLGRLDETYGNDAFYVHLIRERMATGKSFRSRVVWPGAIMQAYENGILMDQCEAPGSLDVSLDYYDTVNSNIRLFLKDKHRKMEIHMEDAMATFPQFWERIGARGDLQAALAQWHVRHNRSVVPRVPSPSPAQRLAWKINRGVRNILASQHRDT